MIFLRMFTGCMLQMVPFAFLCIYSFKNHLLFSKKKTFYLTSLLILALCLIFAGICCYMKAAYPPGQTLFVSANIIFMCTLIPCMGWYLFAVREIPQKKIFIFFFTMTGALAMTSIGTIIETKLQWETIAGLPYSGSTLLTLTVLTAVVLPLLWLLIKYCYLPVSDGLSRKESGYLAVLSIFLFMVLASGLIPIDYINIYNPMSLFLYFALLIAVFVIYLAVFKMLFYAHEKLSAQQGFAQMQHQLELRDEQYRRITDNVENSRRMRHDLRHHLVTLQGYLSNGAFEKAEEYLSQYVKQSEDYTLVKLCDNPVVNMLVSHYQGIAKEMGIAFTVRINIPMEIALSDSDISVLMGNLLENAIKAANHAPREHRYILLNMICSGKMLAITVDNGFDGNVKTDHSGIGLKSIETIAEKYNGGVEFTYEDMIYHSSVMLGV